jgi:tetratricopeptide (TPR) repeat protein
MKVAYGLAASLFGTAAIVTFVQPQVAFALSAEQINTIAKQVTVLIDGQAPGSGVLIARQGQTYYVLTAAHVVPSPDEYQVVTPDGKKYLLDYKLIKKFPDVDLALVQFNSPQTYPIATIGRDRQLTIGTPAFVSGFPQFPGNNLGAAYRFADGDIAALATRAVGKGYALAYYNDTFAGMSGGPIFDLQGQLIGIHGASKTAFSDNQGLSLRLGHKVGLNLGIPIDTFLRFVPQVAPKLKFPPAPTPAVSSQLTASDFYIQGVEQGIAGNNKAAVARFDQAIRLKPDYTLAYLQRGNSKFETGDRQGALADYERVLRLNPSDSRGYMSRGMVRIHLGDLRAAISDFDQAIRLDANSSYAYNNRAVARVMLRDYQGAIADTNQLLRLNPKSANAYNIRGAAQLKLENYQAAIADASQAIRLDPNFADAYNMRGASRRALKDFQGALADYDQVIRLNPNYAEAFENRGLTRVKDVQDYPGGIADYDQAIRLNPNNATAYLNRGFARVFVGDRTGAKADWQKAADLARSQENSRLYEMATQNLRKLQP